MADRGTVITVAIIAAIALGQSDNGNESQVGRAGTKLTNGAAAIAEKASGVISNPGLPSGSVPDVAVPESGAATSTSSYDAWYAKCLVDYSGNDMSSGRPRKSPAQCREWAKGKAGG